MKMSKAKKRVIFGFVGMILACTIFLNDAITNVTDVQATPNVLDGLTTKYDINKNPVDILEIVPNTDEEVYTNTYGKVERSINFRAELGYFMPWSSEKNLADYDSKEGEGTPQYIGLTSRGGVHGNPGTGVLDPGADDTAKESAANEYRNLLENLRKYGLVKPDGADNGWVTHVGEYPIFGYHSVFSKYQNTTTPNELNPQLVRGVYALAENGNYYMDPTKYTLNEKREICTVKLVSGNSASQNTPTVSANTYEIDAVVSDIDPGVFLPQSSPDANGNVIKYITKVTDGTGNVSFAPADANTNRAFIQYYGYSPDAIYYEGYDNYHKNSDWFSEYVLGSNEAYRNKDANYTVKPAGSVTVEDIEAADLVYISGTAVDFESHDISKEVMEALYNKQINYKHLAIIMDYAVYSASSDSNVSTLAALLWQESHSDLLTKYEENGLFVTSTETATGETLTELDVDKLTKAMIDGLKETMLTDAVGNGNFVTGNVYVYNHHTADFEEPKSMVDALDNFANGDFASAYKSDIAVAGFSNVINYIVANNENSDDGGMSTDITPAVVIQYILLSDGQPLTVMKSSLRVLEIQPVPAYLYNAGRGSEEYQDLDEGDNKDARVIANRKEFIDDYLTEYYADRIEYISFTSMTVAEFNGHNEDLVENYDIIYIGDETHRDGQNLYYERAQFYSNKEEYNPRLTNEWNETAGTDRDGDGINDGAYEPDERLIPAYVDSKLTGNIYYNIGDLVQVFTHKENTMIAGVQRSNLYGYLDNERENGKVIGKATYSETVDVRFNGRDITQKKLTKMVEFLDSNGLMIVAENLLGSPGDTKNTKVNPTIVATAGEDEYGRVDSSSNLYELLQYGLGNRFDKTTGQYVSQADKDIPETANKQYGNMVAASDIKQGYVEKEDLNQYVASEKLGMILMERPAEYAYGEQEEVVRIGDADRRFNVINENEITYLGTKDNDGTRYLYYKFSITSEAALGEATNSYVPHLYIDINNDGKYSKTTEDVMDCVVTVDGTGEEAPKDEEGNYRLSKDVVYALRRDLSSEYNGILKWKLDIQSAGAASEHVSEEGYTLVRNVTGKKTQINILQITQNTGSIGGSHLDLETELKNENGESLWEPYLTNIPDYELHIKTLEIGDDDVENGTGADQDEVEFQKIFIDSYNQYVAEYNTAKTTAENNKVPFTEPLLGVSEYAVEKFFPEFEVEPGVKGVDMLVLGFGDNFDSFTKYEPVAAIKAFIEAGNPVLMAHDFVSYSASNLQNVALRQLIGMDLYGVTQNISTVEGTMLLSRWNENGTEIAVGADNNEDTDAATKDLYGSLHINVPLSRANAADAQKIALIESLGKEVAYEPNSTRGAVIQHKQAYSNWVIEWQKKYAQSQNSWLNSTAVNKAWNKKRDKVAGHHNGAKDDFTTYTVEKLNDGQITEYPYRIPESFVCAVTHSQWYTLDLTSDSDNDGESDVVVWYALGDDGITNIEMETDQTGCNPYSDSIGGSLDPANGYFIYNKGNVTYTGAGHSDLDVAGVTEEERQLFVNTLLAAYKVGNVAPEVAFYETTDINEEPINSLAIPYDASVTNPAETNNATTVDSSVLKGSDDKYRYQFVDPNTTTETNFDMSRGTPLYFRVKDINLVRGTRTIEAKFYIKVDESKMVNASGGPLAAGEKEYYRIEDGSDTGKLAEVISITIDGTNIKVVDISPYIDVYKTTNTGVIDTASGALPKKADGTTDGIQSVDPYGIYLPLSYLNDNVGFTIYIQAVTNVESISTSGVTANTITDISYADFSIVKTDLLDLE